MIRLWTLAAGLAWVALQEGSQRPAFEVVSIKINKSAATNGGMGPHGGRLSASNMNLNGLLRFAYSSANRQLLDAELVGEPDWARSERYDIEAKPAGDGPVVSGEQTRAMVRSLLEDYFHLQAHRETRELSVYNLVPTRNRPPLSPDQTSLEPGRQILTLASPGEALSPLARGTLRIVAGPNTTVLTGTAISISRLVQVLQARSDRLVIDKTGFTGLLDFHLTFGQELAGDATLSAAGEPGAPADQAPSLFQAIQEIGFKLEGGKASAEVLVIDHVEHPQQN